MLISSLGTCKVPNEIETKVNDTKETNRNETKNCNEMELNKTKNQL